MPDGYKDSYDKKEVEVPDFFRINPYCAIREGDRWFDEADSRLCGPVQKMHHGHTLVEMWNKQGEYRADAAGWGIGWSIYRHVGIPEEINGAKPVRTNPYASIPSPLP